MSLANNVMRPFTNQNTRPRPLIFVMATKTKRAMIITDIFNPNMKLWAFICYVDWELRCIQWSSTVLFAALVIKFCFSCWTGRVSQPFMACLLFSFGVALFVGIVRRKKQTYAQAEAESNTK